MKITYQISEVAPYINWAYFYHAWGMSGKPEDEKTKLRQEAEEALHQIDGTYQTFGLFELFDANADGDDIVVFSGKWKENTSFASAATWFRLSLPFRLHRPSKHVSFLFPLSSFL